VELLELLYARIVEARCEASRIGMGKIEVRKERIMRVLKKPLIP
jgi:hypothetical protein